MKAKVLSIAQVKADLNDAVRMAVAEIERFLAMFHPIDAIRQHQSAQSIAGQWLSRVKGFHRDDDFLHLVRDFLSWVSSGGERSLVSDQLSFFFSGFMPSYGSARTFLGIVSDGGTWTDVRAFMHSQTYGNARQYVEKFDWSARGQIAQTEAQAWLAVLKEEDTKLAAGATLLAFVAPDNSPWLRGAPVTDVPAPVLPASTKRLVLTQLLTKVASLPVLVGVALLSYSPRLQDGEDEELERIRQQQAAYAKQKKLAIPAPQVETVTKVDTVATECKPQIERNKENGAKCENDGYVLMEKSLAYKRLIDPPKGRGLDGLFEKTGDMSAPNPMPQIVSEPPPGGKLVFIPETDRPPKPRYKAINPSATSALAYPMFVVFEAKHISKGFDPSDTEGIKKEARRRLGETCDGTQMSVGWIGRRIPQALGQNVKKGAMSPVQRKKKSEQIDDSGYARWIFVCLPGNGKSASKLFVLIDVEGAGMNLDQGSQPSSQDFSIDESIGGFA